MILIILVSIQNISAQEVNGIIYDSNGVVPEFEVINKTENIYSKTNENGFFKIKSNLGDTLIFQSITYQKQTLVVQEKHINGTVIIELKNSINALDQVNISSSKKEFNVNKENKEFNNVIEKDRKENSYEYTILDSKGNIYKGLVSMIKNLFPGEPEVQIITLSDYQKLFSSDETLNYEFLKSDLKIPVDQYNLFFDYLESKSLSFDLLDESNRLDLIQKLYSLSEAYISMLPSNDKLK